MDLFLEYSFKNKDLLKEALTHASLSRGRGRKTYERLEFLGDRVLGLIIAESLFDLYPKEKEGDLAKRQAHLVSKEALLRVAKSLSFDQHVAMSEPLKKSTDSRRDSLLADAVEAVIAALYLDGGLEVARTFVKNQWAFLFQEMGAVPKDAKSTLQEWAQKKGKPTPLYRVLEEEGPHHAPSFTIEVLVEGYDSKKGTAPSKKQAEQQAAQLFLERIKKT